MIAVAINVAHFHFQSEYKMPIKNPTRLSAYNFRWSGGVRCLFYLSFYSSLHGPCFCYLGGATFLLVAGFVCCVPSAKKTRRVVSFVFVTWCVICGGDRKYAAAEVRGGVMVTTQQEQ